MVLLAAAVIDVTVAETGERRKSFIFSFFSVDVRGSPSGKG